MPTPNSGQGSTAIEATDLSTASGSAASGPAGAARVVARCDMLKHAPFSDSSDQLFRPFLGEAHHATILQVMNWAVQAGMTTRLDGIGNVVARYEATAPGAPAILIGSHIDSVRNAGAYDGPLGVLLGIDLVARFHSKGERFPFALEVIAFGDEEGSRFPSSMMCSRAVTGALDAEALDILDSEGISVGQALETFPRIAGQELTDHRLDQSRRSIDELVCFVEAHIEQGPLLEAIDEAIGVATSIAGQQRYQVTFCGQAGHAGTTSMLLRKDALAASAEAIQLIENVATSFGEDLVATVGQVDARPGAVNVIPGQVAFTLDIRSGDDGLRKIAAARILEGLGAIAERRGIAVDHDLVQDLPPSPCDPELIELMVEAVRKTGSSGRKMVSGAGHDTMVMSKFIPSILLFIRCLNGISHNPAESVTVEDVDQALDALEHFIRYFPYDPEQAPG
ncbi:allantoate amidohydrolase [Novosphingobium pentaromativorans]|uniref:Allantoate amidohydrolase n=1 Tax=Novosphingobium pentaromativorans US6-1 TaxID=1088721 RepID=G6EEQ4_9SPHN|nr:allantoate amidohydrolase [Novosphingobium pentaromativorans]EHJ60200.1 allantoate amidohydrolase [Novosphingobium pentaromativorans US6-1]